jgi:hypothetical protein
MASNENSDTRFKQQFAILEDALAAANAAAANWGTPAEIFAPLQSAGIIGVGDISVAFTRAVQAEQQSRARVAGGANPAATEATLLSDIVDSVKSVASMASTIISLLQTIFKLTSLDVTVRGFVMNASPKPFTYVLDQGPADTSANPYLKNCRSVSGPLGAVLPGAQQIADPITQVLQDCVAISPWTIANDKSHTGAFAMVLADMGTQDNDGNQYAAMGWGVPYSEGSRRTIIAPCSGPTAEVYFDHWDTEGTPHPESMSEIGSSYIGTQKNSLNTTEGRFVITYTGIR